MITILYDNALGQYKVIIIKDIDTLTLKLFINIKYNVIEHWEHINNYYSNKHFEFYINSIHIELINMLKTSDYFITTKTIDGFVFKLSNYGKLKLL